MKTRHYISPESDEVVLVSESSIMAGSTTENSVGVSIDSFSSSQTDYSDGWQIL